MIENICNKCGSVVREETNPKLAKEYPYFCPNCDENRYGIETHTAETVYIASVTTKHYDLYEQDDDGTEIIGIYKTLDGAFERIYTEYEKDKAELLAGSCKPGSGNCIIDPEYTTDPFKNEDDGIADAMIGIRLDGADGIDREYQYDVERRIIED